MLESLQDIEIASRLVGFDADNDDTIDDKYKKLHCEISPLPHDSEDYRLIEKFLQTTHAPTHTVRLYLGNSNSLVLFICVSGVSSFIFYVVLNATLCSTLYRIGVLSLKKFFHLKGKENLISMPLTEKNLVTGCCYGMVG